MDSVERVQCAPLVLRISFLAVAPVDRAPCQLFVPIFLVGVILPASKPIVIAIMAQVANELLYFLAVSTFLERALTAKCRASAPDALVPMSHFISPETYACGVCIAVTDLQTWFREARRRVGQTAARRAQLVGHL